MADARAEKDAILNIKINASNAIQQIGNYEAELKKLKDEQAELKKQLDAGDISLKEYAEQMSANKVVSKEYGDASRQLQYAIENITIIFPFFFYGSEC